MANGKISDRSVAAVSAALVATAVSGALVPQVKTNVPDPVPGARPAIIERIRVHGFDVETDVAVRDLCEREGLRRSRRRFGAAKETQRLWYAA